MASARRFGIFISTIAVLCLGSGVCQKINHERGQNLSLKCDVPGKVNSITWKHGNDKMVEWSEGEKIPEWYKSQGFKGDLNTENGDVQLFNLQKDGTFTCEIMSGSTVNSKSKEVVLWDKPSKPGVTCERNDTQITLYCSVNPKARETVEWSGPNGLKATNETLIITKNLEESSVFFCSAVNPATKTETEFKLQDCKVFSESEGSSILGIVLGVIFVIGIVFGIVMVFIYKDFLVKKFMPNNHQPVERGQEGQALQDSNNKQNTDLENQANK